MIDLVDRKVNSQSRRCLNFSSVNLLRQYPTYGNVIHEKARRQIYRNYLFLILNPPLYRESNFCRLRGKYHLVLDRYLRASSCHRRLQNSFGNSFFFFYFYFSYASLDPAGFENEDKFQDIQRDAFLGRIKSVKKKNYMNVGTYVYYVCLPSTIRVHFVYTNMYMHVGI